MLQDGFIETCLDRRDVEPARSGWLERARVPNPFRNEWRRREKGRLSVIISALNETFQPKARETAEAAQQILNLNLSEVLAFI